MRFELPLLGLVSIAGAAAIVGSAAVTAVAPPVGVAGLSGGDSSSGATAAGREATVIDSGSSMSRVTVWGLVESWTGVLGGVRRYT